MKSSRPRCVADTANRFKLNSGQIDLATIAKNRVRTKAYRDATFDVITTPTPIQQRAFDLLDVSPHRI